MRTVLLLIFSALTISLSGQIDQNTIEKCNYESWLQEYETQNPGYTEMIQKGLREFRDKKVSEKRSSSMVLIPVHVIIVHPPGQSEGSGSNFTLAHVQSQIDVINQDFGAYNSDFNNTPAQFPAGDSGIQFCLATVDPNGNATDGITRYGTNTSMGNSSGRTEVIAATKWPREDYMNIWSAPNLPFLGLATVPGTGGLPNSNQDFILVASSTFGGPGFGTAAPYNLGRTTTHEIGHWLGLDHIWGGGCSFDDGISDTPNQADNNFGCPNHPSPSCNNGGDMFMNYMDYVDDACMFAFSIGQGQYMNTILNTSRASLQGSAATACSFVIPLTLTVLDQADPNCSDSNDGYILVEAGGGSPNYSYSIDGGAITNDGLFTDLAGGSHTVEVFDADGVSTSVTVFLNTPLPLSGIVDITITNDCPNQSMAEVTIETSGGTNPYFYSLNMGANQQTNTFDELANGFYAYQVTDNNGCVMEGTFEVAGADDIEIEVDESQNVTCFGSADGSISILATGGSGVLTYAIDGGNNQTESIFENLASGDYLIFVTDSLGCYDSVEVTLDQPTAVEAVVNTTDLLCNGDNAGELSISASGGAGMPFSYSINGNDQESNTISDLAAGEYIVMTTDSLGCADVDTVTINEPSVFTAEATGITDNECFNQANGTTEIDAMGGTNPYLYILNNDTLSNSTITELEAGSYTITVLDDNNCATDVSFDIGFSQAIQVETEITDVACNGLEDGTITVVTSNTMGTTLFSINGGTAQDDPTFTNLGTGDYEIIISDETGCDGVAYASITEPEELILSVDVLSDVSCFGGEDGQAIFTTTGGTGAYFYQYDVNNPNPNGLIAGDYNLTVTDDNGCADVVAFTIGEPSELEVSFVFESNVLTLEGIGGVEPYEYSFDGGNNYSSDNSTTPATNPVLVAIRDANGCITTEVIMISDVTDLAKEWNINAYPVPVADNLYLELDFNKSLDASIQIFDLEGRLLHNISSKKYESGENFVKIDVRNFASSIYIVKIASAEGYRYIKVTKT